MFLTGQEEIEKAVKKLTDRVMTLDEGSCQDMLILPLYGSLPPEAQVMYAPLVSNFPLPFLTE